MHSARCWTDSDRTLWAYRVIEHSHVVLLLVDPVAGITQQDQRLANIIIENNKSVILVLNKWDLLEKKNSMRFCLLVARARA
jgi:GTP-binding protein